MKTTVEIITFCSLILLGVESALGSSVRQPCVCAAMDTPNYKKDEVKPLVERSINVLPSCNKDAAKMCNDLCTTLAKTTKDDPEGAQQFCKDVNKDITNVKVSVYSKTCDQDYTFTGLTFEKPICCANGEKLPCKE